MRARAFLIAGLLTVTQTVSPPASAQRDHWTEHLRAEVEIVEVAEHWDRAAGCGRATVRRGVRARVLAISEGSWEDPEIILLWPACSRSYEALSAEIVGRRFSIRLRRFMHASELDLPRDRQPRWYVWGRAAPLD